MVAIVKDNERFLGGITIPQLPSAATVEYRRIVLLLDDGKSSELAIPRAVELTNHYRAELVIMRIFKPVDERGVLAINDPAVTKQALLDAEQDAKSLTYKLIKQGIAARSYAVMGSDITAACPYIQSEEADLVVVAHPVVTRWSRLLFGDPVAHFRKRAGVPVLSIERTD